MWGSAIGAALLILALLPGAPLQAAPDPAIRAAWKEVESFYDQLAEGKATPADDPQRRLGAELFRHYLEHPETEGGARAAESAFQMWSNTRAIDEIVGALPRIDVRSEVWSRILISTENAYHATGRTREYRALCRNLERSLTHPRARSELLLDVADRWLRQGREGKARERYEEVLRLHAEPLHVQRAQAGLHELEALGLGNPAPAFTALDIDGRRVALSEARGSVVLLEFWAPSCVPCVAELPTLRGLHARNPTADLRILGVSLDEDVSVLRGFLEREKLTWPQILAEGGSSGDLALLYNALWIPRTYLIDRRGRIAAKDIGGADLEKEVARQLRTRPPRELRSR